MELTLDTPIQYVPRCGPVMAKRLDTLGIHSVQDLLFYPPFRYDDFSLVSPIARVQPGETVTVGGTITAFRNSFTKSGKKLQQAQLTDETGSIDVIWFNQPFLARMLPVGTQVRLAGKIDWFGHKLVMTSPVYEITRIEGSHTSMDGSMRSFSASQTESIHTGRLVPVYPATEGVSQKWLRGRIAFILEQCAPQVLEYLSPSIISKYRLMAIQKSIEQIHYPTDERTATAARRRLGFDEFLFLMLAALEQKRVWETTQQAYAIMVPSEELASFIESLPFQLTDDQKRSVAEILADLAKPFPMNRLLEGDVGSGKTVVAAIAMYAAFRRGYRSVLMAPTQILAEQHFHTLQKLFAPFEIDVTLVTSDTKHVTRKTKKENISHVTSHVSPAILVGTHALLSESVSFTNVALVIIDEQQRFGVKQRLLLRKRGLRTKTPHLLTMTATPIPRTVALTVYGNVSLSVLHQMPAGRKRVKTWVVPKEKREKAYAWIKNQHKKTHGQAFVICPLIDESETLQTVRAATKEYEVLRREVFRKLRLALLHGRLKPKEKTHVLDRFRSGRADILVTTPVVEVGLDIPNATIMLIEAADRFGLSQLHQLRGRVGRGVLDSYCLLFTESEEESAITRLKSMETIYNGPELAEVDLKLRGPGELFGTRQHGVPVLTFATFGDTDLIHEAQSAAQEILARDPTLTHFPLLREKLKSDTMVSLD